MNEIEFIKSKDEFWIPVIDKKTLHSTVNPILEAEKLIREDIGRWMEAKTIIVLGLGGGYHIDELKRVVAGQIVVIEASEKLARSVQEKRPEVFENVEVLAGFSPGLLLKEEAILNSFSNSHAIFRHPASLRIAPDYYRSVQEILGSRSLPTIKNLSARNWELKNFFDNLNWVESEDVTLQKMATQIQNSSNKLSDASMIWLALRELVK